MNSTIGPLDLPKRFSLSTQAAAAVRKAIEEGIWQDFLPSERRLCDLLQVSRPTIRTALQSLAQERRIEINQGRRNRILARAAKPLSSKSRLVILVTHQPLAHMSLTAYQGVSEMRAQLAEHGFTTEVLVCPARSAVAQTKKFEAFMGQNRVLCCVLVSLSRELQEWFSTHPVPALVLGSCHTAVKLPSLDIDYRALCRHAAGLLRSKGHRRIAFIVPDSDVAGDLASAVGFREGLASRAGAPAVDARVVRHSGTPAGLTAKLDDLFKSNRPPTALLVAKPQHIIGVAVYLLKRGLKVPDSVSLIARDHDYLFESVISHYRFESGTYAHRLSRLMLQLVGQGRLAPAPNLIFPSYVSGGTVKLISE